MFLGKKGLMVKRWSWTSVTSKSVNGNKQIYEYNIYSSLILI